MVIKKELDPISYRVINSDFIQLEDYDSFLLSDLPGDEIKPLKRENPYSGLLNEIINLMETLNIKYEDNPRDKNNLEKVELEKINVDQIRKDIKPVTQKINRILRFKRKLEKEEERLKDLKHHVRLMKNIDLDIAELKHLSYISLVFGRVSKNDYERLIKNITELPILIIEVYRDEDNVWFFSFTKKSNEEKALNILDTVYFEKLDLPPRVKGQPRDILDRVDHRLKRIEIAYEEIKLEFQKYAHLYEKKLKSYYRKLKLMDRIREINNQYYGEVDHLFVMSGWITATREIGFRTELEKEFPNVIYTSEEIDNHSKEKPPTVLKNFRWFKPFESLVELYGVPRYGEIDPTPFMAITYLIMFGIMFGDVGQGLIFFLLGYLMKNRYIKLGSPNSGALLMGLGFSSTVFGFLYGSIFGLEHILPALWVRPFENIMMWLGMAIGLGVILMLISMVFNLINCLRRKDIGEGLFSRYGLTGLFFYLFALATVISLGFRGGITATSIF